MLPGLDRPRILDIGCGAGEPTLELAHLTRGEVIGIDINRSALDTFKSKIDKAGLSNRVQALNRSMFNMDFPDESFDIVWSEGSIFNIGFTRGLKDWRRLLRPEGFLVVHEMVWLRPDPPRETHDYWKRQYTGICSIQENLAQIDPIDYTIVGHFALPDNAWWILYFGPLERRVQELRVKYANDPHALQALEKGQREVDMHKKYYRWYGSAYFIMQKRQSDYPLTPGSS